MVNQTPKLPPKKKPKRSELFEQYSKYSGMAFQMIFIILCGALIGRYLDTNFQLEKPLLTVLLALVSIGIALYVALKDFISK